MRTATFLCILLLTSPALSSGSEAQLLGIWQVEAYYTELKGTGEKKMALGEHPSGYLIFTPEKRMMAVLTGAGRTPPKTDEDRVAAFRSMFAYSGIYRVEGDRWITKVDVAWNEAWNGTEQMRLFRIEGDTLTVTAMWQPSPNLPGNPEARGVITWIRMKPAP